MKEACRASQQLGREARHLQESCKMPCTWQARRGRRPHVPTICVIYGSCHHHLCNYM